MNSINQGQLVEIEYEGQQLKAIVIDPNGLGNGQATIGLGFRMGKEYLGISEQAMSKRVTTIDGIKCLKLPSGKFLRVTTILASDGNEYKVIEFGDWSELAQDFLKEAVQGKSKLSPSVQTKMIEFLAWFAVKGLYATSYAKLKGAYTESDDNALTQSLTKANEQLIADNEILKLQYDRKCSEVDQLLYRLDAIEETNSNSGTDWRHWELEQNSINF
ncbi:hypothetical protein NIES4071_32100 [Calothrix sp. NIES-4071]|nr:hypothetical protein NIES4071_32100 [Calothrix sp. NIES-4071]BAZ57530.1 hypothetical protein NIES4105_32040 [Calothrix sp. NIES-4105]